MISSTLCTCAIKIVAVKVAHQLLQDKEDWINSIGRAIVRHSKR